MVTRSWFIAELQSRPGSGRHVTTLEAEFDTFAGAGNAIVDKKVAEADRDRLWAVTQAAKSVVDQFVAHQADATSPGHSGPALVTWRELDTAIDAVGELYRKYYRLRYPGTLLANLEPDLPAGWDRIFESAWKTAEHGPGTYAAPTGWR